MTRPKPAYGRQGLDWIVGPEYSFGVLSTSCCVPAVLSLVEVVVSETSQKEKCTFHVKIGEDETLQTDRRNPWKIGGEEKMLQKDKQTDDRHNPQGIPNVVQKRDDNNRGIKLTSFGPKM